MIHRPPDGHNHPLWIEAVKCATDDQGRKLSKQPKYLRHVTSTALQLAMDHAFTGSYAKRFRPSDPPESVSCPCGAGLRDPPHLILHCPRFLQQRINAGIYSHSSLLPYNHLYAKKGVVQFLSFLTESKAGSRPAMGSPDRVPPQDVPPEPG